MAPPKRRKAAKKVGSKIPTKKAPAKKKASSEPISKLYSRETIHCMVNVGDLDRAKNFYTEVLELETSLPKEFPYKEAGWYEFHLPVTGARLGLNLIQEGEVPTSGPLAISVTNLETTHKALQEKKAKPTDIMDIPDMVSMFSIKDTEGNSVSFVSDPRVKTS